MFNSKGKIFQTNILSMLVIDATFSPLLVHRRINEITLKYNTHKYS